MLLRQEIVMTVRMRGGLLRWMLRLTVMLLATFVIVLLWDTHRLLGIGGLAVASAVGTLLSARRWYERLVNRPPFMGATVAELQRDAQSLRAQPARP